MSKSITDKEQQVNYLKERLQIFVEVLDAIDPETADLQDIDRLRSTRSPTTPSSGVASMVAKC